MQLASFFYLEGKNMMLFLIVLLFCYGTYQLLCYLSMFPSMFAGRMTLRIAAVSKLYFIDYVAIAFAERLVKTYNLQMTVGDYKNNFFNQKGIYFEDTILLISKLISFIFGVIMALPLAFINIWIFLLMLSVWFIFRLVDIIKLRSFQKTNIKNKDIVIMLSHKLLLGVFFIAQIMVILFMLT